MKCFIIAGERSGDLFGSLLVQEIRTRVDSSVFFGIGGERMRGAGVQLIRSYEEISFMGFWEVIIHLPSILQILKLCKNAIKNIQPDLLILVDFPSFNLRLAKYAKSLGIKTVHYISPKVWAWRENRVRHIKVNIDLMIVTLPFEERFYAGHDYTVHYAGSPVAEVIAAHTFDPQVLTRFEEIPTPRVAILPGSRRQEVRKILPILIDLADRFPLHRFLVSRVDNLDLSVYQPVVNKNNISLVTGSTYELIKSCQAAIVTSGTATLETALIGTPQIVVYRTSYFNYLLARAFIKTPFISLVNIIAEQEIVKELIQEKCDVTHLAKELNRILEEREYLTRMRVGYDLVRSKLGISQASSRAADLIVKFSMK